MTKRSLEYPGNRYAYATATLIASCIMFLRVILVSSFYNPSILITILFPATIMLIVLGGAAYYYYILSKKERHVNTEAKNEYKSPFELVPALQFAGIVVAIKFIAGIGLIYKEHINASFFYPTLGALSGLADVDAITYEMSLKSAE